MVVKIHIRSILKCALLIRKKIMKIIGEHYTQDIKNSKNSEKMRIRNEIFLLVACFLFTKK